MSSIKRLKKEICYEANIARCETCKHYKKPFVFLTTNSNTKKSHHYCNLHQFTIAPNSLCNTWESKNGAERLE